MRPRGRDMRIAIAGTDTSAETQSRRETRQSRRGAPEGRWIEAERHREHVWSSRGVEAQTAAAEQERNRGSIRRSDHGESSQGRAHIKQNLKSERLGPEDSSLEFQRDACVVRCRR
jgi:hypothetical protein